MNEDKAKLKEYEAIRCELRENKKFIYERAAISVIGILALINYVNEPIIYIFLPTSAIGLLIYNLFLTTNRFISSAHMAAYIARFHEGDLKKSWFGWENYLYYYRRFNSDWTMKNVRESIKKKFEESKEPKSKYLFNYHRIFYFHRYCSLIFLILSVYNLEKNLKSTQFIFILNALLVLFNTILFAIFFILKKSEIHPKNIVSKIDYFHDFICKEILTYRNNKELINDI